MMIMIRHFKLRGVCGLSPICLVFHVFTWIREKIWEKVAHPQFVNWISIHCDFHEAILGRMRLVGRRNDGMNDEWITGWLNWMDGAREREKWPQKQRCRAALWHGNCRNRIWTWTESRYFKNYCVGARISLANISLSTTRKSHCNNCMRNIMRKNFLATTIVDGPYFPYYFIFL